MVRRLQNFVFRLPSPVSCLPVFNSRLIIRQMPLFPGHCCHFEGGTTEKSPRKGGMFRGDLSGNCRIPMTTFRNSLYISYIWTLLLNVECRIPNIECWSLLCISFKIRYSKFSIRYSFFLLSYYFVRPFSGVLFLERTTVTGKKWHLPFDQSGVEDGRQKMWKNAHKP